MNHEIYKEGKLAETLVWDGPEFTYPEPEPVAEARRAFRERAIARAYEIGGISYERRNERWLESDHYTFSCEEVSDMEVSVTTPLGRFFILASRVKKGSLKTAVSVGATSMGFGARATEDQDSLPVELNGRLNAPGPNSWDRWTFQPSSFVYADGTHSDFLGSYPMGIRWEVEPKWDPK